MKRIFSGLISLLTVTVPKLLGYEKIKKDGRRQKPAEPVSTSLPFHAKGVSGVEDVEKEYTLSDVAAAKDFIWAHLHSRTKSLMIQEATTDVLERHGLVTKEIFLSTEYR